MTVGRLDHPQPRWGGQAITSCGRHGTGIGMCEYGGSAQGGRKNERKGCSMIEERRVLYTVGGEGGAESFQSSSFCSK